MSGAVTYDAADGYVLLVTPNSTTTNSSYTWGSTLDTWVYSAGNWSLLSVTAAPPNRAWPAMTYDAKDGYVVLFGGDRLTTPWAYQLLNDTWTFSHGTWSNRSAVIAVAPPAREYAHMIWDAADNYTLLWGGFGGTGHGVGGNYTDTWSYVGGSWTHIPTTLAPVPQGAIAYDGKDGYVLYFGGGYFQPGAGNSQETWKYLAGAWTNLTANVTAPPSPRAGAVAAYDTSAGVVILFGGCCDPAATYRLGQWVTYGDLWTFSGSTWTYLSNTLGIANRTQALMVYDPAINGTILIGGWNPFNGTLTDTWIIHAGSGSATPAATQAGPYLHVSPSPATVGKPITVSTIGVLGGSATTYTYRGLPSGCVAATLREFTCTPSRSGTFELDVTVNTTGLGEASARTVLEVAPAKVTSPGPSGSGSSIGGVLGWIPTSYVGGLLVGAAVTAGVGTWLVRRGRQRTRAHSALVAGLRSLPTVDEPEEPNPGPPETT